MLITDSSPRHLNVPENVALSFFWFTSNVQWTALIIIMIPAMIRSFVGDAYAGSMLAIVSATGALLATFAQPIFGAISDRSLHPWGRRRPFMLVGVVLAAATLVLMGRATTVWQFGLAFFALELFANFASAPYQALIPDIVEPNQRGTASGYLGLMNQAAVIVGVLLPSHFSTPVTFELLAALQLLGLAVTLLGVREVPARHRERFSWRAFFMGFWLPPRQYPNWWWVFITRLLVLLGFATLEYYLYYYLLYAQHLVNPNIYLEKILLLVTAGSLVSVLTAGWLSDRLQQRKILVTIGGLLMGVSALTFVLTDQMSVILGVAFVFGFGYGMYLSTDWALAVDVLPATGHAAKDMGLWAISQTLSQMIANIIGGVLLLILISRVGLGSAYRALYLVTFFYFVAGSFLVLRVRNTR